MPDYIRLDEKNTHTHDAEGTDIKDVLSRFAKIGSVIMSVLSVILSSYAIHQLNNDVPTLKQMVIDLNNQVNQLNSNVQLASGKLDIMTSLTSNMTDVTTKIHIMENITSNAQLTTNMAQTLINGAYISVQGSVAQVNAGVNVVSSFQNQLTNMSYSLGQMDGKIQSIVSLAQSVSTAQISVLDVQSQIKNISSLAQELSSNLTMIEKLINSLGCVNCGRIIGLSGDYNCQSFSITPTNWTQCGKPRIDFNVTLSGYTGREGFVTLNLLFDNIPITLLSSADAPISSSKTYSSQIQLPASFCWNSLSFNGNVQVNYNCDNRVSISAFAIITV
jgi:outer membrane murein-binding lipoprotein Lpp